MQVEKWSVQESGKNTKSDRINFLFPPQHRIAWFGYATDSQCWGRRACECFLCLDFPSFSLNPSISPLLLVTYRKLSSPFHTWRQKILQFSPGSEGEKDMLDITLGTHSLSHSVILIMIKFERGGDWRRRWYRVGAYLSTIFFFIIYFFSFPLTGTMVAA